MLRRRPAEGAEERPAAKEESPTAPAQAEPPVIAGGGERETAFWRLPSDLGRLYGAISGDRNPIHMHPLPARALGFPGAIAHGMWTFARALATLAGELADGHAIEASFQRPIVLPASVQLSSRDADGEREFAVRDVARQTSHMRGRIWATPGDWPRPTTTTTRKQEA